MLRFKYGCLNAFQNLTGSKAGLGKLASNFTSFDGQLLAREQKPVLLKLPGSFSSAEYPSRG